MTTKVQAEFLAAGIISDQTQVSAADADHLLIFDASDNSLKKALVSTITSSGASAADDITAGDAAVTISTSSGNITIDNGSSDDDIIFKGTDGGSDITALTLDMSDAGRATFNGSVDIGGGLITRTGDLTLDVSGVIVLDADNAGVVQLKDGGSHYGSFYTSSDTLNIQSNINNADINFIGKDDNTNITALTLDMSNAGSAYFNNMVGIGTTTPDTDGYSYAEDLVIKAGASADDGAGLSINSVGRRYGVISFLDSAGAAGEIFYDHTNNDLYFKTAAANRWKLDSSGNMIVTGNVTAYGSVSDERLKENIKVIENPIEKIKNLKGITFTYKKDGEKSTGLIAQDLEKVLPEAVYTSETIPDEINGIEAEEHLAIRYGNTVGLLVEAIKELEARVKELEDK